MTVGRRTSRRGYLFFQVSKVGTYLYESVLLVNGAFRTVHGSPSSFQYHPHHWAPVDQQIQLGRAIIRKKKKEYLSILSYHASPQNRRGAPLALRPVINNINLINQSIGIMRLKRSSKSGLPKDAIVILFQPRTGRRPENSKISLY